MHIRNNTMQPLPLDNGDVLAAAGTDGSVRDVESLSDNDRRLVDRGLVSIILPEPEAGTPSIITTTAGDSPELDKRRVK
ncbi:MAG: hypothetical protein H0T60_14675 [Acidobacteria bacterium]|nr:hypothetical protein [Acidobacteriota bacterium]